MLSIDKDLYCHISIYLGFGQDEWTPLMIASHNGHVDVVNVLLQHGASVHLQNKVKLHVDNQNMFSKYVTSS